MQYATYPAQGSLAPAASGGRPPDPSRAQDGEGQNDGGRIPWDEAASFQQLSEHIDSVFWLVDPREQRLLYVSPRVTEQLGLDPDELAASDAYWRCIHPDDRERVHALLERPDRPVETEFRFIRPDGAEIWVNERSFPVADAEGIVYRLAAVTTDVTARHLADPERAFLAAAIERSQDAILLFDPDGRALYANPAAAEIAGVPLSKLVGSRPGELLGAGSASAVAALTAVSARGESWSGDVTLPRADGSVLHAQLTTWPLMDQEGHLPTYVVVVRDMTALQEATDALAREQAEREALTESIAALHPGTTLEETATTVVHELLRLEPVVAAGVIALGPGLEAMPIAAEGPVGIPVGDGDRLPAPRAAFLHEQAGRPPHATRYRARPEDGEMGAAWESAGVTAIAWLPLQVGGEPLGLIAVATSEPRGVAALERQLPALTEYASMACALLAPGLRERLRLEEGRARVDRLIADRAFHSVFQPVVELGSAIPVGYEVLTRFDDGLSPHLHFAEADAVGRGIELEVATLAAAQGAAATVPETAWISLNVSPALVLQRRALRRFMATFPRRLVLELTEHVVVDDYRRLRRAVTALNHQARLAVDDAGAGFASLRHIIELRPDFVKLDIGLIRGVDQDPARQSIVAGMAHFAATTGCVLIAEGIETEGERQELRRLGISFGQGFLFGRPTASSASLISVAGSAAAPGRRGSSGSAGAARRRSRARPG